MNLLKIMTETPESELLPYYKYRLIDIALKQSQKTSQLITVIRIG